MTAYLPPKGGFSFVLFQSRQKYRHWFVWPPKTSPKTTPNVTIRCRAGGDLLCSLHGYSPRVSKGVALVVAYCATLSCASRQAPTFKMTSSSFSVAPNRKGRKYSVKCNFSPWYGFPFRSKIHPLEGRNERKALFGLAGLVHACTQVLMFSRPRCFNV